MFKKLTLSAAILAASTTAFAQDSGNLGKYAKGGYAGAFYSSNTIEEDGPGYDLEADPSSFGIRAGYYLVPFIALEARYSTEAGDDSVELNNLNTDVDVSLSYTYGAFVKAGYPTKHFEPYLLLGWNKFEVEFDGPGGSESIDDNGVAVGLGLSFFVDDKIGLNLEVLNVHSDEDDDTDVEQSIVQASLGVVYSF